MNRICILIIMTHSTTAVKPQQFKSSILVPLFHGCFHWDVIVLSWHHILLLAPQNGHKLNPNYKDTAKQRVNNRSMMFVTWFPVHVHVAALALPVCHKQMDKVCMNEQKRAHRQQRLKANRTKCARFLSCFEYWTQTLHKWVQLVGCISHQPRHARNCWNTAFSLHKQDGGLI